MEVEFIVTAEEEPRLLELVAREQGARVLRPHPGRIRRDQPRRRRRPGNRDRDLDPGGALARPRARRDAASIWLRSPRRCPRSWWARSRNSSSVRRSAAHCCGATRRGSSSSPVPAPSCSPFSPAPSSIRWCFRREVEGNASAIGLVSFARAVPRLRRGGALGARLGSAKRAGSPASRCRPRRSRWSTPSCSSSASTPPSYGKTVLAACFVTDLAHRGRARAHLRAVHRRRRSSSWARCACRVRRLPWLTPRFFRRFGGRPSELEAKFLMLCLFGLGALACLGRQRGGAAGLPHRHGARRHRRARTTSLIRRLRTLVLRVADAVLFHPRRLARLGACAGRRAGRVSC